MIAWFARNHVAANLLMISIILAGVYSLLYRIPLERFPSFDASIITIQVSLRGSTPEDAELAIAARVEESLKDLEGIEQMTSTSYEGGANINVEVESGYDARDLLDDIKNRVDAINTFPGDAEKPIIALAIRKQDVITVTVAGDVSEREIRELVEQVRDDLLKMPSITQVDITGVRNYEIAIELSPDVLREYQLSLNDVAEAISRGSLDLSAGNIRTDGGDILIRSKSQAYNQDDFENIVLLTNADGTILTLGDIAQVHDGFEETAIRTRFNGKLAATARVYRVGKQNVLTIAEDVKNYIDERRSNLPQGIEMDYWDDDSVAVKNRVSTLVWNGFYGSILVFTLLSLFLRPAIAFWVFIGVPISFLGAFFLMPFLGVTFNLLSLFAFIVVLGIVVDDAIVTGENVYRHMGSAESGLSAAINGTKEVAIPVTFGVLTTIVAFVPLAFMGGQRGAFFAQIPLVVVPVMIFSLIESKFVLPAHLKHLKPGDRKKENSVQKFQSQFASGFENIILKYYRPLLSLCLRHKGSVFILFFGLTAVFFFTFKLGHTQSMFFPRIPSETVRVNLTMPTGTPFEVTDEHIQYITRQAQILGEKYEKQNNEKVILNTLSMTGGRGGVAHQGEVRFEISPPESRATKVTSTELSREWRSLIGEIPGAESLTFRAEFGRGRDPIDIELRANDFAQLDSVAEIVKERLTTYPTVFDIYDSMSTGKEEIRIELKPEAWILGVSRAEIIQQVRQAFFGLQAQRIQRGRDDVRVMVRFPRDERQSVAHLRNLLIQTSAGKLVPLSHLAEFIPSQSPTTIERIDGYRTLRVIADVEKSDTNMTALFADLETFVKQTVAQYPGVDYKFAGEVEEERETRTALLFGTILVLFAIYTLLAIPLKSFLQPFVVISVSAVGIIGAILGHWIMGKALTIFSSMGMLALVGVLVNDSLVLVDYINKSREKGMQLMDALLSAGVARFRPVILTSLTTFIGLAPLYFEKSTQAQFLIPMAISLGFGILFATLITLVLVPVNYLLMENLKLYCSEKVFPWTKKIFFPGL